MSAVFYWAGRPIPFLDGETVAFALARAGVHDLGPTPTGGRAAVFCGIGQCQGCLINLGGRLAEACLVTADAGMRLAPLPEGYVNLDAEAEAEANAAQHGAAELVAGPAGGKDV